MIVKKNQGMGLVEIVIGVAIITLGFLALSATYSAYVDYALTNQKNVELAYLFEEAAEIVSFMRDKGWSKNIAPMVGTTYYLTWNSSSWATTTTPVYVDGIFLRSFNLSNVLRDSNDLISNSGTNDPNTKLLTVNISFKKGHATSTESVSTYITNINND